MISEVKSVIPQRGRGQAPTEHANSLCTPCPKMHRPSRGGATGVAYILTAP
jgi:hypothetical protein